MRAYAYVTQTFSPDGMRRFPELLQEHRRLAGAHKGCVSVRRLTPLTGDLGNQVVTLTEFESAEMMLAWRASEDHAWVAGQYGQWWEKPPVMLLYSSPD